MAIFGTVNSLRWLLAEVAVVVLGILIAFQVEEWRTYRSDRQVEIVSLQTVVNDLDVAQVSYESYIEFLVMQQEQVVDLIDYLQTPEKLESERLLKLADFGYDVLWGPSQSAFISMRETGKLELISDDQLRFEVIEYFDNFEAYFHRMVEYHTQGRRHLNKILRKDFELIPNADYLESKDYRTVMRVRPEEFPSHPEALKEMIYMLESATERQGLAKKGLTKVDNLRDQILVHLESR